ncbi:bifunctional (p)ppGpp synthetase/guanosine-3',5'-bis(diphosphate) 3'-pyrophosphohydrolase [Candidatus Falkowbacteria bacterium]|nr:bifunctional (p)ppGpp synthetase/guanosine-3',5'-bis(diphosphate) 3'-pyrophosphohydrolase [Candidatus Falkowbacteria bacterium]
MAIHLLKQIIKSNYPHVPNADLALLERAYFTAQRKLKGVKRSYLDYFDHQEGSALIIAKMKLDAEVVAATLLHDLPYRAHYAIDDIRRDFGGGIADMLTALDDLRDVEAHYKGTEQYIEHARKMFMAIGHDFRVLLIKFAERLDNLRALDSFPKMHQKRIVEMTEKIYIPLLGILGIWQMRCQMDDICFAYRYPQKYAKLKAKIDKALYKRHEQIVTETVRRVLAAAKQYHIKCMVTNRFKHIASIYRKMQEQQVHFNELYDVFALRVMVDTVDDCYLMLGVIHGLWVPVPRRIKDYISSPKPNGYQSLHTTVFTDDGNYMEFQIRTKKMDDESKYGLAAHWYYKGDYSNRRVPEWVAEALKARLIYEQSGTQIESINFDALTDNIFCYTPRGDIIELPRGSTPVDFAYTVHSDLGHYCRQALINDIERPLNTRLRNNDVVEIIKKRQKRPFKKWLQFVKTAKARETIHRFYHPTARLR